LFEAQKSAYYHVVCWAQTEGIRHLTHITGHFRDESLELITFSAT